MLFNVAVACFWVYSAERARTVPVQVLYVLLAALMFLAAAGRAAEMGWLQW